MGEILLMQLLSDNKTDFTKLNSILALYIAIRNDYGSLCMEEVTSELSYHIIISYHITSYYIIYHIISYIISYCILYHTISYIISYIISYHIIHNIIYFPSVNPNRITLSILLLKSSYLLGLMVDINTSVNKNHIVM